MAYATVQDFLRENPKAIAKGPVALIFIEDDVEVASTLNHAIKRGFKSVIAFTSPWMSLPDDLEGPVHHVNVTITEQGYFANAVNAVIAAAPTVWFYYGFNAEYIFYPFCETRTIGEATIFATEERRDSILTFVVDGYPAEINAGAPLDISNAMIDKAGYYALARTDEYENALDREMNFFGGLRWRFEGHVPADRRRIDRVSIFRAKPGLELRGDHTFNEPEYNTYECPWHHSITATLVSFRVSKALLRNPGSRDVIKTFMWPNSVPLEWRSQQLLDLGLMEPGQWF